MSWKHKLATVKSKKADFPVLALCQSNCGLCVGLHAENGATLLVGMWCWKNKNKLVEWKVLLDMVGIKSANWED